jgi:glycosyltransferase involved in cell wall biosynthesis
VTAVRTSTRDDRGDSSPLLVLSANSAWNLLNFSAALIEALKERGFRVAALVPNGAGIMQLQSSGVEVHILPMHPHGKSPIGEARLLLSYVRLLRKLRPAAYLGFTIKPNIYGAMAARLAKVPTILNVTGLGTGFLSSRALETLVSLLYKAAFGHVDRVFFQNSDDRDQFLARRWVKKERQRLIPGAGVDLSRFAPASFKPSSSDAFRFLFIGRVLTDKGLVEFAEAARAVRRDHPTTRFCILGPSEPHPKRVPETLLQSWVEEGLIDYLGSTDDVRPYMADSDCVVLPSYREGLPTVLMEAAAMARPVIATDVPGCRHVVEDGVTGFLCEVRSSSSLAEAMSRILDLGDAQRQQMGESGRRRAETAFSQQLVVSAYFDALLDLGALAATCQDR